MSDTLDSFPAGAEGKAVFKVNEDVFQTWYTVYGDLKSDLTPLVLLNGGPGCAHFYLLSCYDLYKDYKIPLIFYDQLGTYNSSKPEWKLQEKPKEFWTPELFLDELENLVKHLGIENRYDLLGHSWGGMMAAQIAAQRQPRGLRKIILSNTTPSIKLWVDVCVKGLIEKLPEEHRVAIRKHEADGSFDHPDYQAATKFFYARHVCRLPTMPEAAQKTFDILEKDHFVYGLMEGPSEFTITGTIKNWDITEDLHNIKVPTLIINGEFDEATDDAQYDFFNKISNVKWVTLAEASHLSHWEQRERYMIVVAGFLTM